MPEMLAGFEKETGIAVDGVVGVSRRQNLLAAIESPSSGFNETVNADNFFAKLRAIRKRIFFRIYPEKRLLGGLFSQMLINSTGNYQNAVGNVDIKKFSGKEALLWFGGI